MRKVGSANSPAHSADPEISDALAEISLAISGTSRGTLGASRTILEPASDRLGGHLGTSWAILSLSWKREDMAARELGEWGKVKRKGEDGQEGDTVLYNFSNYFWTSFREGLD